LDLRVDFYILDSEAPNGRLQLACKLAEKAYLAEQSVLIWHTDPQELRSLDELLWVLRDGSFVPHEMIGGAGAPAAPTDSPVTLSAGVAPPGPVDVLINLAPDLPPCLAQSRRVIEIIDGDETRRKAGRMRFKAYRDSGVQPASHNIRAD
jgi:DNA polymerase-3 subunit chi